jgi:hypothetical protein
MLSWKKFAIIFLIVSLPLQSREVHGDFIVNGGFEQNNGIGQLGYANTTGGTVISATGWTSSGYNMIFSASDPGTSYTGQYGHAFSLWGPDYGVNNGLTASPNGGYFVGSDGGSDTGAISQTIGSLTVGQIYQVGFWWAAAQQQGYTGTNSEQWQVSLGSQTGSTTIYHNTSKGFSGWMYQTINFTATATSETLSFLAIGTPSGVPPFSLLDGVTMNAVPEPSSLILVGLGLFGVGIAQRRRRRRRAMAALA